MPPSWVGPCSGSRAIPTSPWTVTKLRICWKPWRWNFGAVGSAVRFAWKSGRVQIGALSTSCSMNSSWARAMPCTTAACLASRRFIRSLILIGRTFDLVSGRRASRPGHRRGNARSLRSSKTVIVSCTIPMMPLTRQWLILFAPRPRTRRLEHAGVHVVYGLVGLKTHAKCILVVRREGQVMRHYSHIGTGNYNATTAKLYEDFGLFTADEEIGKDVGELFNHLTGFADMGAYRHLVVAPEHLRLELLRLIAHESQFGSEGRIVFKANSLVDEGITQALYDASMAGVNIDLILRGICCLRPGIAGMSDTIRVRSILGRYLEHSRIYHFANGDGPGREHVLIGSADLMERNLDRRVEVLVPVRDDAARKAVWATVEACLEDNRFAWELRSDGRWEFVGSAHGRSAQDVLGEEV